METTESLRRFKSSTEIKHLRNNETPGVPHQPSRPPRSASIPSRKISEPALSSSAPLRPPRKVSEPNYPSASFSQTYDKTSLPAWASLGRKISSISSLPPVPSLYNVSSSSLPPLSTSSSSSAIAFPQTQKPVYFFKPGDVTFGSDRVHPEPGSGQSSRTSPSTPEVESLF